MDADETLMTRHAQGSDPGAFRVLFDRYAPALMGFFRRAVGVEEVARDLVQTTFLHLHRARADYDGSRPFRPWLYTIAVNVKREHWRRRRRKPETSLDAAPEQSVGPDASSPSDRLVRSALDTLPDNQREVLLLRWFLELSFPEIGVVLGIQANAAKVRAHRGMKALQDVLGGRDV